MLRAAALSLVACLIGSTLAPRARAQASPVQARIAEYEAKLADAKLAGHDREAALDLIILGYLYRQAGEMQKALADLNLALPIEKAANNKAAQALAMSSLGRVYSDIGEEDRAIDLFQQAWAIWDQLGIKQAAALVLTSIGKSLNNRGEREKALTYLKRSLDIWHSLGDPGESKRMLGTRQRMRDFGQLKALKELNDALPPEVREQIGRDGEASTLDSLGMTYSAMGRGAEALEYFNRALPLWQEAGQHGGEALTLNNMGRTYADLGRKQDSLAAFGRALQMWRATGNRQGEALTLNNMGRLYRDLGLQQTALDYYNQALPIWRETGTAAGEGLALNDIGRAYADLGQPQKAIELSQQALPFWRKCENLRGEAMTLNNMGRDYFDLGDAGKSLDYDSQALALWRRVKDRRGESLALMTVGWAEFELKQWDRALASELTALALAREAGDPEIEGGIETALMIGFRLQHYPREAILFGIEAVNAYQSIRRNLSGMDKDLQAGFAQSKSMTYRILAELLIEAGRLGEAEEILDLLKEQELKDTVRTGSPDADARFAPPALTPQEQKAVSEMEALAKPALALEQLSEEAAGLEQKTARTPEEDARLKDLSTKVDQQTLLLAGEFAGTVLPALEQPQAAEQAAGSTAAPSALQSALAKLGPGVIGIRMLVGEDRVYEIEVTADARKKIVLDTTPADLRAKALETLRVLRTRDANPQPQLAQLYAMIVAPLEPDLKAAESADAAQNRADTLLWSLDDAVRYVPIAALYDGHRYMLERFNNVLFTPESYTYLADPPPANGSLPSALAVGLSKSYGGLPALPGVLPELEAIVHDPAVADSHGPMPGKLLPDDQFTLAALKTELGAGNGFPVVHIASHFVMETGGGAEPYLMLGGENAGEEQGFAWPLSDMENSAITFRGARLLTLSACSTAKEYTSRNGIEMDSLGMVAQQKDAEAVLATLWDVNDASTSRLMSDFYARWLKDPGAGKAEALRQAQLALLKSEAAAGERSQRGFEAAEENLPAGGQSRYSHPYYWAPFVLIGNFR